MENINIEKQIETFKERVKLLKEWRDSLQSEISFESKDKVYQLEREIESKIALIEMRVKDLARIEAEKQKESNEVKANYVIFVNKMKEARNDIKEAQALAIIDGIIKRSEDKELSLPEMTKDYKLMKSIMAIVPKEKKVETTEMKVAE
jgi:hypothetical protein